jgi:hypothetical protein
VLFRWVKSCEHHLREVWAHHKHDNDLIVLGDLRRPELLEECVEQHGRDRVDQRLRECESAGERPSMAFLQDAEFVDRMPQSGDWAHRETAKELKGFLAWGRLGIVPLLVVYPGGLWATMWARPDSKTIVGRYKPEAGPESN